MQLSKKLYTTLIIAVLTVSTLMAAIPMASALTSAPGLYTTPFPASGTPITAQTVGNVGDRISVVGNSTHGLAAAFRVVTAYWDGPTGAVLGTTSSDVDGNYRIDVVIPAGVNGTHYIVVDDGSGAQGAMFEITPSLTASTSPPTAEMFTYDAKVLPGDALLLTGNGYAANDDMNITLVGPAGTIIITSPSITTDATGSFSATIVIPTIAVADYGDYDVNGTDEVDNSAVAAILINYYNTVTPASGPSGITITISGRIPANTDYTILVDTTTIRSGTSGADGRFSETYTVPDLIAVTDHDITVRWVVGAVVNTRVVTFEVTLPPEITAISATSGVAGTVITISGTGFSALANITLYFGSTVVNSTALNAAFGPTTFGGAFTDLEFTVPAIAAGIYILTVKDQYGATTGGVDTFTVLATPTTSIALRGSAYYTGNTLSFDIMTTEANLGEMTVTIMDPSGDTWWTYTINTVSTLTGPWSLTTVGPTKFVLYQDQIINGNPLALPADAPLGSWNWTIAYTPNSIGLPTKATALFTVSAVPTMQAVLDRLDEMEATITDVITTTENDIIAVVNTKTGTIMTDISSLDAQLTSIDGGIATISTSIGDIQTTLAGLSMDALGADITTIKNGVATIQTNLGTVSTAVSNLDAKLTNVQGDVATVLTNLGTLDGKVTSIDGKVATVETDVGTIQADVSDVKASADQTPVWIAVVLSLVAAIAAIFAVITIRQKIAG